MANNPLTESKPSDWNAMASEYKTWTSGPGTQASHTLLTRLNATSPFSSATSILDIGCGPGPVTSLLIATYGSSLPATCSLRAGDFSEGMVAQCLATKTEAVETGDQTWPRVEVGVMNAMDLSALGDGSQSHVMAGWVFMLTPEPRKCLSEALRVLKPGGALACTSWAANDWMQLMFATKAVRPEMPLPDLAPAWKDVGLLKAELEAAGFRGVVAEEVPVVMPFEQRERLVEFFTEKIPVVRQMTRDFSEEERGLFREAAMRKCVELCPDEPGVLHGTALLAVGTK